MNILNTLAPVGAPNGSAVALGYFDGVHLGHRRVLGAAVEYAAAHGLTPAAFTFSLPGGQSLKGGRILSAGQKHARVAALGITAYMEPPFESFRSLSPEDFVNKILVECFAAKAVFCGDNFTFGAYAAGNVDRLKELCAPLGIAVTIVDMAQYGGQTVSSTRIRAALEEGRIEDANAMLGAPYCIDWPVRHGKGIGTSKLGKPTINQNYPADALQPCTGVYLTRIWLDGRWWPSATGIGRRPTVDAANAPVTCETYVPGYHGDTYGQMPVLEFHHYLCAVRKFEYIAGAGRPDRNRCPAKHCLFCRKGGSVMRRKDREVADLEGQLAILEQCPVCRVAINDPASGVPYLVPLNFGMAAGPQSLTLYFHCAPVGTKLDLLRADPNVSFEADCPGTVSGGITSCTYGMNYQSVIGRGTVRFVEGGEKLTALQALMQHYHCPDLPFEPEMVEHTTVLALDVAAMTGKRRTSF
ncbi:MAG: riboflavin kinase [Subdoligranulum sp.]